MQSTLGCLVVILEAADLKSLDLERVVQLDIGSVQDSSIPSRRSARVCLRGLGKADLIM